jgi:hypothetical protein
MIPQIGRTVHYVLPEGARHPGQHRAATISQIWTPKPGDDPDEGTPCQLHVLMDAANDGSGFPIQVVRSSVQDPYGKAPGSWHQMERVKAPAAQDADKELATA